MNIGDSVKVIIGETANEYGDYEERPVKLDVSTVALSTQIATGKVNKIVNDRVFIDWDEDSSWIEECEYDDVNDDRSFHKDVVFLVEGFDKAWASLEESFEDLNAQIKAKMAIASKEIREAIKISDSIGVRLKDIDSSLYSLADAAGWQMSSIGC